MIVFFPKINWIVVLPSGEGSRDAKLSKTSPSDTADVKQNANKNQM